MKRIAVYCGASKGNKSLHTDATVQLGTYLAEHNLELVYGGGKVHGVMPQELVDRGASLDRLTDLKVVDNMSTRKKTMLNDSDGCIALPGGPGTLEEIIEAFSWARLGDNDNPCVFYNVAGYYDSLRDMFDNMVQNGYLTQSDRSKLLFSDSLTEIFEFMENYIPPRIRQYSK